MMTSFTARLRQVAVSIARTSPRGMIAVLAIVSLAWSAASPATALAGAATRSKLGLLRVAEAAPLSGPFSTCSDQTYALCATAKCFVFNAVAYCKCDVEHGDSISLSFDYAPGKDVCTANAAGADNGYMISTFSLPSSVRAPEGDMALYTCPAATSNGAYAQCDGGYCFESTRGRMFPGFEEPLTDGEIICSCPMTVADPETARVGFQIAGPYPCQQSFFANCNNPPAGTKTGDTIYVGAPSGTARFLARKLYGHVPPLHQCALEPG